MSRSDFDNDGFADLAIGVAREAVGGNVAAGAVNVLFGSAGGLTAAGDQLWHQDSPGVLDVAEASDLFGHALAAGDFNADGFADLAIGVPFEDRRGIGGTGAVNVLRGSAGGLTATGDQLWPQDSPSVGGQFGLALTTGDFNGDGFFDLAVGVPSATVGGIFAGAVNVLPGSASGLTAAGNQLWHQGSPGVLDRPEQFDGFGTVLATGDFNGDGFDDLAVGLPLEGVGGIHFAGAVNVLRGSAGGLTAAGDQFWHQDSPGVRGVVEDGHQFGSALTTGDFNGDGFDDLAIGVPSATVGGIADAGAVNLLFGSADGLTATGNQLWHQDSPGVLDVAEEFNAFGDALAAGDFNADGFDDLAIGVTQQDIGGIPAAGAVNVLFGSAGGLTAAGDQFWHQDSPGVLDVAGDRNQFGNALTVGDFNGDGFDDLAIGVPFEDVGDIDLAGATTVLFGSAGGLTAAGDEFWHQDSPGVRGVAEEFDLFGFALT